MDTMKNIDNKVGKDCQKNGSGTCTRKEKIRLNNHGGLGGAVEWMGLARTKDFVCKPETAVHSLFCEVRRLETEIGG